MGDPRKRRKKYEGPSHPWNAARIEAEKETVKAYAMKNKKEIWKLESKIRNFKKQAKQLVALKTEQADKELKLLMDKLYRIGLLEKEAIVDDVLALTTSSIMERRLQALLVKRMLARTQKQARQFITHKHVSVKGKKISSPNYIVLKEEEETISFDQNSSLASLEHPERFVEKLTPEEKKEIAAEKPHHAGQKDRRQQQRFGNKKGRFQQKGSRRPPFQNKPQQRR